MNNSIWNQFITIPSKEFGYDLPECQPSVFREYRGEIWTRFHCEQHPAMSDTRFNIDWSIKSPILQKRDS